MSDVFISYARSTEAAAARAAEALRAHGYGVWRDDALPAHRAYADVIEERLRAARAVLVLWSAEAVKSQWVRAEADVARLAGTVVQASLDGAVPPLPFNQIQYADLRGWEGEETHPGWRKLADSIAALASDGPAPTSPPPVQAQPLPLPRKPSIAVLPFANQTGDPEQAYFVEGMAEEITGALSRFSSLFVIAAGSTAGYGQGPRDLKAIARELGVRYLLEGSVRRSPERVRISVGLSDVILGRQVWADKFDAPFADLLDLEDKVVGAVAAAIDASIGVAEAERIANHPPTDMGAYDLWLRASALARNWTKEGCLQALALLDQAIARDPDYARPISLAAFVNCQLVLSGWSDDPEAHRRITRELSARALYLAPNDSENLCWVAGALQGVGDLDEAIRLTDRAMAINAGASNTLFFSGWMQAIGGDAEAALERFAQFARIDPRSPQHPFALSGQGVALMALRRFDEAAAAFADSFALKPDFPTNRIGLAACWGFLGKTRDARRLLTGFETITPDLLHDFDGADRMKLVLEGLRLATQN